MKIEKLPSGSYRIRKMYKGKTYSVVFDRKPTQKEAVQAIAKELDKVREKHHCMNFHCAAEDYIETKRNLLSPSTIRSYNGIIRNISKEFLKKNIYDITAMDIQAETNKIAKNHSPKTVRNYHGFISAVLGAFYPDLKIHTTLPQKIKNKPYIPSDNDIKRILEHSRNTKYEIPIILACYGMRRSEICALTLDNIDGDVINICKAKVLNEKEEWVIKTTKTTASTREVVIPSEIADKIRKQGYVYKGHPNSITEYLEKTEKELDIPKFSLHKLRHYFASKMSSLNIAEEDIMKMGGWETDYVMKGVYRHALEDKNKKIQRDAAQKLRNAILN